MEEGLIDLRGDDLLGISRPMRHCGRPKEEDGWSSFVGPCSLEMSDEMHSSQDAMRQPGAKGS